MEPQATQNTFCTYTGSGSPDEAGTTIFFVSGNPGLIGYYHPFLSLLARYLAEMGGKLAPEKTATFQIYGCSLGGFEVDDDEEEDVDDGVCSASTSASGSRSQEDKNEPSAGGARLFDLEDQIRFVQRKLTTLTDTNASAREPARRRKVILIGHSVGAYIAMELVRRHREAGSDLASQSADRSSRPGSAGFDIVGGVMLFPTVMDIAHSPSGQKLTVGLDFPSSLFVLLLAAY